MTRHVLVEPRGPLVGSCSIPIIHSLGVWMVLNAYESYILISFVVFMCLIIGYFFVVEFVPHFIFSYLYLMWRVCVGSFSTCTRTLHHTHTYGSMCVGILSIVPVPLKKVSLSQRHHNIIAFFITLLSLLVTILPNWQQIIWPLTLVPPTTRSLPQWVTDCTRWVDSIQWLRPVSGTNFYDIASFSIAILLNCTVLNNGMFEPCNSYKIVKRNIKSS